MKTIEGSTVTERVRYRLRRKLKMPQPCATCGCTGHRRVSGTAQFAEAAGVGLATIQRFALGKNVRSDILDQIAAALEAEPA